MKILVIMGSPRKGETYAAVQKVEQHLHSFGEVEFEYLWLKDANLGQCRGCHACIRFGEQKCPLKNDLPAIVERMLDADGLLIATPVYALQVSYLVKTLFDEMCYLWHRPRFFGKFVMAVCSGGGQFKDTLNYIKENVEAWGATYVNGMGVPHADALVPKMRANVERDLTKAARRFYDAVQAGRIPAPKAADLIRFRVWKLNARACKDFLPADYQYFTEKGWFQQDYYTSQPVGIIGKLFGMGMEKLLQAFMRSVYVGY